MIHYLKSSNDLHREILIDPVSRCLLMADIKALDPSCLLVKRGDYQVYYAKAKQIPNALREIGRLREYTFRAAGEGTGKQIDIDSYDQFYFNLFIWNVKAEEIVGGYRMGLGDELLAEGGTSRLYINSLFKIDQAFNEKLKLSVELGRSYIIPKYQKAYLPLFLLWRGILSFLMLHSKYRYLIGPVSISKYYSDISKSLLIAFVKRHYYHPQIAQCFTPRTPYFPVSEEEDIEKMLDSVNGNQLGDLECFLKTIEPVHIKLPVLFKQYTRLNARFVSFNLDPNFSNALDGLMLLDLQNLPVEVKTLLNEK